VSEGCYFCIDLKSFYASVECVERGLDPLTTKLAVADSERGNKTVCLAVTPALKNLGIKNRCRLFQIPPSVEYIKAVPRMKLYIEYSVRIYKIYLKYFSKDDIHVYSIDEVFIDAGKYLKLYGGNSKKIARKVIDDIFDTTGITASCGIGTNLYLAKVALDIMAKTSKDGIAELDEESYKNLLWEHRPITDFWRVGKGTAERLKKYGIYTMRQLALADEKLIYRLFGRDAELLIDHGWGRETTEISDIKAYIPKVRSITSGQVLSKDYDYKKALLIIKEMVSGLCLELVEKGLLTDSISVSVGYSKNAASFRGKTFSQGNSSLSFYTDSYRIIIKSVEALYEKIAERDTGIRRVNISFNRLVYSGNVQLDMFSCEEQIKKDKALSRTIVDIKSKYGRNSVFSAMSLQEDSTAIERNKQIGGHKA